MLNSWRFGLDRFRCTCTYHCSIFHNVQFDLNIQYYILHSLQLLRSTFLYIVCHFLPYKPSVLSFGHTVQDKTLFINNKKIKHKIPNKFTRGVWRYQREVIRIHKSKKDRQHNGQKKKRTKTVISKIIIPAVKAPCTFEIFIEVII